ncbi:hypothetical protein TNCV_1401211 [Trichonephila clavipes]|nr:hypothetical protein TNCV_1401211 [Trichonephila clavipes]
MPRCRNRAHCEQLSEFERGRFIGLKRAVASEHQQSGVVLLCYPPPKEACFNSASEKTHVRKDNLLTIAISDNRTFVQNVKLSPPVQQPPPQIKTPGPRNGLFP